MNMQKLVLKCLKHTPRPLIRLMAGAPSVIDGNELDPNLQLLSKMAPVADGELGVDTMRQNAADAFIALNAPRRKNIHVVDDDIPGPAGKMPVRIYEPQDSGKDMPAILFFHQGGLVLMDLDTCDTFCTILADECGAKVISLDYRLCPEHAFPAAIDDAKALWAYVQANAAKLGIDPKRVGVAGDSAGGLISAVLCQMLKTEKAKISPNAQLLIYPWVTTDEDNQPSITSCAETFPLTRETMTFFRETVFPNGKHEKSPKANPLKARSLKNLPPAVVATAGFDPIRDQGNVYAEKLTAAGNDVTHHCFSSLTHSFIAMGNVSRAAEQASIQIAQDFARYLNQ